MCTGSKPEPPPPVPQPPPPPPVDTAAKVGIGDEEGKARRKVGRSQLRSQPSQGGTPPSAGLGN